uniref:Si:cabz01080528.1 n=1 Tax=Oryzias melastigma TaxID=30732 RepID=A0A3B3DD19_ORYME
MQEDEAGPHPLSLSVSDYLTPSWSLSPSSSPLTHSEPSDSDREEDEEEEDDDDDDDDDEEEDMEEMRGRILRRRKKRKIPTALNSKKKSGHSAARGPGRPCSSFTHPASVAPPAGSQPPLNSLTPPTTNINNNISINIGSSGGAAVSRRQHCPYCGRHFRSLARHLEKYHANQPEVRTAMELAHLHSHSSSANGGGPLSLSSHSHSFAVPQPSPSNSAPPSLFQRERESPAARLGTGNVSFSLSLSPPSSTHPAAPKKSCQHVSPLLSSLSCLVIHLRHQQHSSFLSLTRSPHSAEAWRLLCHASLSLLILYNRHRECEVAKLSIQDYRNRITPQSSAGSASSMEAFLSPFERHVLCHLPRAGVLGKRGRVQPLILPPHCESCIELLLRTSPNVGVDPESPYVFSRPYHSPATPLRGTDLLRNLARASGAKNPGVITGTRVRRQVAILTQLLLLEEGDSQSGAVKRLEDFLEREYHVTQSCSAITRDPALMGRVGRVVLYGEREGVLFRGMSLQDICLELDMSGNSADSFSEDSEGEEDKEEVKVKTEVLEKKKGPGRPPRKKKPPNPPPTATPPVANANKRRSTPPKSGKRGVLKRPWSEAERVAVETHLKRNLLELRVPAKADCERCLELCPLLVSNQRDWR